MFFYCQLVSWLECVIVEASKVSVNKYCHFGPPHCCINRDYLYNKLTTGVSLQIFSIVSISSLGGIPSTPGGLKQQSIILAEIRLHSDQLEARL